MKVIPPKKAESAEYFDCNRENVNRSRMYLLILNCTLAPVSACILLMVSPFFPMTKPTISRGTGTYKKQQCKAVSTGRTAASMHESSPRTVQL